MYEVTREYSCYVTTGINVQSCWLCEVMATLILNLDGLPRLCLAAAQGLEGDIEQEFI